MYPWYICPPNLPQQVKGTSGNNRFAGYRQYPKNSRKDQIFGFKVFLGRKKFVCRKKAHALFYVKDRYLERRYFEFFGFLTINKIFQLVRSILWADLENIDKNTHFSHLFEEKTSEPSKNGGP